MKMKVKGVIYKVTHKQSGKTYIGATKNSIHQRKLDHTERASRGEKGQFQEAIGTYGPEAFTWTQIDTANSSDELAQKEKMYIFKYNSKADGYNADSGGGFKKSVYQYNLEDGSLVEKYDCLESACNTVGAIKQQLSRACLSVNKTFEGYYWSYECKEPFAPDDDKRVKSIIQIDMSDNILNEFKSVSEASEVTGINKSSIAKVCRGERNHAGGYKWSYK